MELANFKDDFWHLRNGEKCHRDNPDTFWIPSLNDRKALKVGDAAKIILEIECEDEMGQVHIESERGYVIISQIVDDKFIGILDFQPCCIEPNKESVYLGFGVEIPFGIEHIIDIDRPPQDYIDWQLDRKPEKVWYRR